MDAWLLTWEGKQGPVVVAERKILAILSGRRSPSFVEDVVDMLYCQTVDSAYDMMLGMHTRKQRVAQYRFLNSLPSRFFYGRDPCIYARLVTDLTVHRDEEKCTELVRWTEPAIIGNADSGSGLKEIYPSQKCEIVRSLRPLAFNSQSDWT